MKKLLIPGFILMSVVSAWGFMGSPPSSGTANVTNATGVLPVAHGGTNRSTAIDNQTLFRYYNGAYIGVTLVAGDNISITDNGTHMTFKAAGGGGSDNSSNVIATYLDQPVKSSSSVQFAHITGTPQYDNGTAGDNLTAQNLAVQKTDGKWYLAKATDNATSHGLLGIVVDNTTTNSTVTLCMDGPCVVSGLSTGAEYFIDNTTAGNITTTRPVASGETVRSVGYEKNGKLYFKPSVYISL